MKKVGLWEKWNNKISEYRGRELIMGVIFVVCLSFLFSVGLNSNVPKMGFNNEDYLIVNQSWKLESPQLTGIVNLPIYLDIKSGETITITKKLTGDTDKYNSIMFFTSMQTTVVSLDGTVIYEYGKVQNLPLNIEPVSAWHIVRLPADWDGKEIIIEFSGTNCPYVGNIPNVYMGHKSALLYVLMGKAICTLFALVPIFTLGLLLFLVSFFFKMDNSKRQIRYLGIYAICSSIWIACDTRYVQLYGNNIPLAYMLSFMIYTFFPIIMIAFLQTYSSFEKDRMLKVLFPVSVVAFISIHFLRITNILGYESSICITHLIFTVLSVYLIIVILRKFIWRDVYRERDILISLLVLAGMVMIDVVRYYLSKTADTKNFSVYGNLFFVVNLSFYALKRTAQEQKAWAEREIYRKIAYIDSLTGLKNRTSFDEKLETYRSEKNRMRPLVMMVDLNDLKKINDQYGHASGDDYIKLVAEKIAHHFEDESETYRVGGDEFCVFSDLLTMGEFAIRVKKMEEEIKEEGEKKGRDFSVACGFVQMDSTGISNALRLADEIMYEKKRSMKKRE